MARPIANRTKSNYGTLGLDVGVLGRWSRLLWGLIILAPLSVSVVQEWAGIADPARFFGLTGLYIILIGVAYSAAYWILAGWILSRTSAWVNTVIFVVPAFAVAWWAFLIEPFTGIVLPQALSLAMLFYIGISFLLQWGINYGGCEVVSIPILLFRRRFPSYCIPLVALDALEKAVVDRRR